MQKKKFSQTLVGTKWVSGGVEEKLQPQNNSATSINSSYNYSVSIDVADFIQRYGTIYLYIIWLALDIHISSSIVSPWQDGWTALFPEQNPGASYVVVSWWYLNCSPCTESCRLSQHAWGRFYIFSQKIVMIFGVGTIWCSFVCISHFTTWNLTSQLCL